MGLCCCAFGTPVACVAGGVGSCVTHCATKDRDSGGAASCTRAIGVASVISLLVGLGLYALMLADCGNWGHGPCWSTGEMKYLYVGCAAAALIGAGGAFAVYSLVRALSTPSKSPDYDGE